MDLLAVLSRAVTVALQYCGAATHCQRASDLRAPAYMQIPWRTDTSAPYSWQTLRISNVADPFWNVSSSTPAGLLPSLRQLVIHWGHNVTAKQARHDCLSRTTLGIPADHVQTCL